MMTIREREAGFSLIEMLVVCGLLVAVMVFGITAMRAVSGSLNDASVVIDDTQYLDKLEARLHTDAQSSLGMRTIDGTGVEFAVTDNTRKWWHWSYRLNTGRLEMVQDGTVTTLDSRVSRFDAVFVPANELNRSGTASELLRGLPTPDAYTMDLDGQQITNGVVRINVRRGTAERTIVLATRVTPSGFGIEAGPEWRTTVYRRGDTKHPFPLFQKTRYRIIGVVEYTTDHWKTAKTWCEHEIEVAGDVGALEARYDYQAADARQLHDPEKIFSGCQHDTESREIAATPLPKKCYYIAPNGWCYGREK